MAFASLNDFFAMGGHGAYVWSAWGVTAALLLGCVWHARQERRRLLRRLHRRTRRGHQAGGEAPLFSDATGGYTDET
jgi:heme exporter protein D